MSNTKTTKRALWSSVLALFLCFSMLLGTTYAWFTDSVTSEGNIIVTGFLEVAMKWANGIEDPADATWKDASKDAIFNFDNWEPGYVDVKHVKISNNGSLALQYFVNIKANGVVSKLAEVLDVYFVDPAVQVTDRTDLSDEYRVGTLAEVLNGAVPAAHGDLLKGESDTVTIAIKMQESAGNEYQSISVGSDFSVQVFATQLASEADSFNNQYDKEAVTYVTYDADKTVAENAAAFQAALDAAEEGDIILLGTGNWYATQYKQFKINTDGITLIGANGAVLGFAEENRNSILDVHGDNVTIRNIEFNKNKNEYNQCILAIGAENLTVDSCTFYGENYQGGNTPTIGIYIFENLDSASDEANDEVTKFTIINNNFLGAAVGMYKGGANTVPNDPGVATAEVSEDMIIENNTFVGANILIENWRSWSKECTRDHEFVPTIENNTFVSPNLCFANTPHSIYLRCYRQGNPDQILPADYIDNFVANNTIATPANDTAVTYNGASYVLSDDYGTFYRDNATYGIIAYCYGQSYVDAITTAAELSAAIANGGEYVLATDITDINANTAITVAAGNDVTIDLNGHTLAASANKSGNQELFLVKGNLTFKNGSLELVAENNQGWGSMVTLFDVTAGGVLTLDGVSASVSGSDMNFVVHLNNWGAATATITNCDFDLSYVAVRAFNSGYDMNTVTIKNTDVTGGARLFWVHNFTAEGKDASTLNLDIYGNNNTSDNANPVRFGFSDSSYFDLDGNVIE